MFKKVCLILFSTVFLLSLPLAFTLAADAGFGGIPNPLGPNSSFAELFVRIINWIVGIATTLAVLMVVIGGIQYMISGGNEDKIKSARKTIQWALIGLIILLMSWSLLRALLGILGVSSSS